MRDAIAELAEAVRFRAEVSEERAASFRGNWPRDSGGNIWRFGALMA